MFAAIQSLVGTQRRKAMLLVAAWFAFSASQVFATCCLTVVGAGDTSTPAVAAVQHQDESVPDDCCDTAELDCQIAVDGAPPAAPVAGLPASEKIQHLDGLPVRLACRVPVASVVNGPARVPIPQAPTAPIYVHLKRFLI